MLSLQSCSVSGEHVKATYRLTGSHAPASGGAVDVDTPVELVTGERGAEATLPALSVASEDEDGAFAALADRLESLAATLRARGVVKYGVPVYGSQP